MRTVTPPYSTGNTQESLGDINNPKAGPHCGRVLSTTGLGNVLMRVPLTCGCCRTDRERHELSEYHCERQIPFPGIYLPKWKHSFHARQRSMSNDSNCA